MNLRLVLLTITVIMGAIMELIDTSIVNVALTQISGNLGVTVEDVAWVITSYAIANVIIIPITGFLSNLFGRKRYYLISVAIFIIFSFLCGTATNIWTLVAYRFFQGIGGGALLSISQVILFEAFGKEKRNIASAIFGIGIFIGPTIGPTLGGYIIDHTSWQWIFLVNIPIGIVVLVATVLLVENPKYNTAVNGVDWLGLFLLIIGIGALQVVLERGEIEDWFESKYILILSIMAALGISFFIYWELKVKNPVVNLRVLSNTTLSIAAFLTFISGVGIYTTVYLVPIYTQRLLSYSALQTGLLLLPGAILAVFFLVITARSLQKGVSPKVFIVTGFLIFVCFCWQLSQINLQISSSDLYWPLILRAVGTSMMAVPLTGLAVSGLKPEDMAQGAALNNMMRQLGGSFGIATINTFINNRFWYHKAILSEHISIYNTNAVIRLNELTKYFESKGMFHDQALKQALISIEHTVNSQSYALTYSDSFLLMMVVFIVSIPILFLSSVKRYYHAGFSKSNDITTLSARRSLRTMLSRYRALRGSGIHADPNNK